MEILNELFEMEELRERLWRAERALELLESLFPDKVEKAKRISSGLVYESTMGSEMWSMADGLEEIKS